jgi:hypothetical protein
MGLASRCDSLVVCAACGRKVARQMRGQRYCSARCRDRGRGRCRKAYLGRGTRAPTTHPKKGRMFNDLRWAKRQSSSDIIGPAHVIKSEIFDRRSWEEVINPDGVAVKVARYRPRR